MRLVGGVALVCAVSSLAIASAQDSGGMFNRDRNVSVMERVRPEYRSGGIQSGAFVYSPVLNTQLELNDNIFATGSNEQSDGILVFSPSLNVVSTWSRHSFSADASLSRREYFDFSDESVTNASVSSDVGLDIGRGYTAGFGASYDSSHEPRTSAGAAGRAADPISYDTSGVYATLRREVGRTRISGGFALNSFDYDDALLNNGVVADQDDRDRDEVLADGRVDYAISPDTAIFGRVRYTNQNYTNPGLALARDQEGFTFDVGASFDLSNLARGELGIGYLTRSFDETAFDDVSGLSVDGQLEWFPTPLITVTLAAGRSVQAAAIANSPAYVSTTISAGADYELRRNIILSAQASFGDDDYEGVDRNDRRSDLSLRANYLMNRYVGFSVNFLNSNLDSTGLSGQPDFTVNRLLFGVVLQR